MNQSNKRSEIQKTLVHATSIIELAKQKSMNDAELLRAINLIQQLHEKKATAATAAINSEEFTEKVLSYLPDKFNKKDGSVIKTVVNALSLGLQDLEKH